MFARVEICPFGHKTTIVGNKAHEHWLQWQSRYHYITDTRAKLGHDKDVVNFTCEQALDLFEKTWKHYYRRIY